MTLALASDAFLEGYRLARLEEDVLDPEQLIGKLLALEHERTPFAFEGAGMALEVRDAG